MNILYVSIRTTENYHFNKFRTAGVTGNAFINSQGQGENPVYSNRDEISQPTRHFHHEPPLLVTFVRATKATGKFSFW